jgi:hypothetical protein
MDPLTTQSIPSLKGSSFLGFVQAAAVAGTFATVQLWNPAASGKLLVLRSVIVFRTAAGQTMAGGDNVEVANPGAPANSSNKFLGGAVSTGLLRTATPAAARVITNQMFQSQMPNGTPFVIPLARPIIIPAAYGYTVADNTAAGQIGAIFDHDEVPG